MRINGIKTALVAVSIAISAQILSCQSLPLPAYETALMDGEASHADYDFQAAVQFYSEALRKCRDTSRIPEIERRLSQSRNGRAMAGYCQKPKVVARKNFSLKEFFLYYPLADRSWRPAPNRLDTLGGIFSPVTWFPRGSKEAYWSMPDTAGVRNIYYARDLGTRWSSPYKMPFSSTEDEIFPMVSGGKLYFASKGLFGVGGYDIYVCERRADGRWGEPRNLGFPYSSPYDDFLFVNTPDGRYSIFASNRDCSIDSVSVYVIEREINPVSSAVSNVRDLRRLCRLDPPRDLKKVDNKRIWHCPHLMLYACCRQNDCTRIRKKRHTAS